MSIRTTAALTRGRYKALHLLTENVHQSAAPEARHVMGSQQRILRGLDGVVATTASMRKGRGPEYGTIARYMARPKPT
jgi:hypothetical protein